VASPSASTGEVAGGLAVGVDQVVHATGGVLSPGGQVWQDSIGPVTG
jgi:hypothetical protein